MTQIVEDSQGLTWELRLDLDAYKRVRTDTKIDLGLGKYPGPSGLPLSTELYDSPFSLLDVCWSIMRRTAEKQSINRRTFDEGFMGEKLDGLRAAFFQEWN